MDNIKPIWEDEQTDMGELVNLKFTENILDIWEEFALYTLNEDIVKILIVLMAFHLIQKIIALLQKYGIVVMKIHKIR